MTDCIMPRCPSEATEVFGMCKGCHAKAFPENKAEIGYHMDREHANHETSMAVSKAYHEMARDGIKDADGEWLLMPKGKRIYIKPDCAGSGDWALHGWIDKDGLT